MRSYLKFFQKLIPCPQKIFLFCLILITFIVFFPSLSHVARHDQLQYIGDMAEDTSWISMALIRGFSYNRNSDHVFLGYDPGLFRPLFYFLLGTKMWLFRYNFLLWQLTSLIFHLFAVIALFQLFWRIHSGLFAFLLTLFFSVLYTNIEMVIWHHISGYMIFVGCIFICLRLFYEIIEQREVQTSQAKLLFFSLLVACLIYELGFLSSIFFFAVSKIFLNPRIKTNSWINKNWRLSILLPSLLYLCLNIISIAFHWDTIISNQYTVGSLPIGRTIYNFFISIHWWLTSGLFPDSLRVLLAQRIIFYHNHVFLYPKEAFLPPYLFSLGFIVPIGAIILYLILIKRTISYEFLTHRWKFLFLTSGIGILQIAVIVAGRINPVGIDILANYSYYNYLFWGYPLVIIYSLIDFKKISPKKPILIFKILSVVLITTLIVTNARKTFTLNTSYAKACKHQQILLKKTQQLINIHGHEHDFSFAINHADNFYVPWMYKTPPVLSEQPYSYIEILYPQFYNKKDPKYIIFLSREEQEKVFIAFLEAYIQHLPISLTEKDIKKIIILLDFYISQDEKRKALRLIEKMSSLQSQDQNFKNFLTFQRDRIN